MQGEKRKREDGDQTDYKKTVSTDSLEDLIRDSISFEIMDEPVILKETGQVYNLSSITQWLKEKKTCPNTGKALNQPVDLAPCLKSRELITLLGYPLQPLKKHLALPKDLPREISYSCIQAFRKSLKLNEKEFQSAVSLNLGGQANLGSKHENITEKTLLIRLRYNSN